METGEGDACEDEPQSSSSFEYFYPLRKPGIYAKTHRYSGGGVPTSSHSGGQGGRQSRPPPLAVGGSRSPPTLFRAVQESAKQPGWCPPAFPYSPPSLKVSNCHGIPTQRDGSANKCIFPSLRSILNIFVMSGFFACFFNMRMSKEVHLSRRPFSRESQ